MHGHDLNGGTAASTAVKPPAAAHKGYRPDIDGLRAIAVMSVVAYHFDIGRVPGGFIGVDIFFVISGFLITEIIKTRLDSDSFSFVYFYRRRITRIFPALLLILITYLVAAFLTSSRSEEFSVTESTFQNICWAIVSAASFFTNFSQMHESNYFSQTATSSPLLHLWSLAIEEQFYILWPLLLYGVRTARAKYLPFIIAVAGISFCANVVSVGAHPTIAFYSPLCRAWELMLGAALACMSAEKAGRLLGSADLRSTVGLTAIAFGLFAINWKSTFPGWWALLPTLGTVLVISAGRDAFLNNYLLGKRFLIGIGLISYPLYLWHWPALLLYQKYAAPFTSPSFARPALKAVAIVCAVMASWLTFRFVEKPIRYGNWGSPLTAIGLALMVGVIGIAAAAAPSLVWLATPLTSYQRDTMYLLKEAATAGKIYGNIRCFQNSTTDGAAIFLKNGCLTPQRADTKTILLIGDSHSAALSLGLRPLMEQLGANFLQVSTGFPCEPTNNNSENAVCDDINNTVMEKIKTLQPDVLIIDSFWIKASSPPSFIGDFFEHFLFKLQDIERRGARRIIIVGQIPTWPPSLPQVLAHNFVQNNLSIPLRTFAGVDPRSLSMDMEMKNIKYSPAVTYLSVKEALCNDFGCLTAIGSDLKSDLVVYDDSHLTPAASDFLARSLVGPALASTLRH